MSLLDRAKAGEPAAWQRLVGLHSRMVYRWCRRAGLPDAEAADAAQEVLATMSLRLAEFERQRTGSFRAWMRSITRNKVGDWIRRQRRTPRPEGGTEANQRFQEVAQSVEPVSAVSRPNEEGELVRAAMKAVRPEFEDRTWQAFWFVAVDGLSPADVAKELGTTLQAVYKAKSRVLLRLRQVLGDALGRSGLR